MASFLSALHAGKLLLMDGAMGTELQRLAPETQLDLLNLSHPEIVLSVHRAYAVAGASVLLTNTFQTNPVSLARRGMGERHHELWQAALKIARAAQSQHFVLADVGPIESLTPASARSILAECQGADGILLETWSALDALKVFAGERTYAALPLLVSFTFAREATTGEWKTFAGATPEECMRAAQEAGAGAVGANCGRDVGMLDLLEIVNCYRTIGNLPLFVRPNAGTPVRTAEGWRYPHSPESMAELLPQVLKAGVTMVGGCCGTTPDYIWAFRGVMQSSLDEPRP